MPLLPDAVRFRLLHGPYRPPRVKIGRELCCEIRGFVRVKKWSDGRIPWPLAKPPGRAAIAFTLCGSLVKAVRQESSIAIQHWWGVGESVVSRWRKALGVQEFNEGTMQLFRKITPLKLPPTVTRRAVRMAANPQVRQKAKETLQAHGYPRRIVWTDDMKALLGTMSDPQVAKRLGMSHITVRLWRVHFGIPPFQPSPNQKRMPRVQVVSEKILERRLELNLLQWQVAEAIGMSQPLYGFMERGISRTTTMPVLKRLAKVLHCRPKTLLAG
jgi:DNA-binding XRE family transcriptional regulator